MQETISPSLLKNRRFLCTAVLAAAVAIWFWTSSRYPQLDHKAMMGAETRIEALGFDTTVTVAESDSLSRRILGNSLNWMYTNRKGMAFGVVFGALLMTLLPFLKQLQYRSRVGNSLLGLVIGMPLGLCVNCSTPVAQGVYAATGRVETMLATAVSSPTLNIIVLTMLFALFPTYLAMIKIGLTVAFVLIGIPLLTAWLFPRPVAVGRVASNVIQHAWLTDPRARQVEQYDAPDTGESWLQSVQWVLLHLVRNLWYVIKTTVPLMILAGVLGAAVVTVLPFESLAHILPSGRFTSLLGMVAVALFGLFLPVPMTFDVIVTAVLLNAGLPIKYATVLLYTLGVFSIYPFLLIGKTISFTCAFSFVLMLTGVGLVAGVASHAYAKWDMTRQEQFILEHFTTTTSGPALLQIDRARQGEPQDELLPTLQRGALQVEAFTSTEPLAVSRIPFNPRSGPGAKWFSRVRGTQLGITEHENYSVLKLDYSFNHLRGIASGDVNNDGWPDLVISSDAGFGLYLNRQGQGYVQQRLDIPEFSQFFVVAVGLVDLNNDGWLDVCFSTYRRGNYVLYSQQGRFTQAHLQRLPNQSEALWTHALAFGDVDRDGALDIVLGNAATGKTPVRHAPDAARSVWLRQHNGRFDVLPLPGMNNETLTTLLSDINRDGWPDLLTGGDIGLADNFYVGDSQGGLRLLTRADGLIPYSTTATMSIASADIDNDLKPEVYIAHIGRREKIGLKGNTRRLNAQQLCAEWTDPEARERCLQFMTTRDTLMKARDRTNASLCWSLATTTTREACIAESVLDRVIKTRDQSSCRFFPPSWELYAVLCHSYFGKTTIPTEEELAQAIPKKAGLNVLLQQNAAGRFEDRARELGLGEGGFTWNAKFADLDNDGWQDLYIVNGTILHPLTEPNYLYRNEQGRKFTEKAQEAGLFSDIETVAYTYTDFDHDGDLDLIVVPAVGEIIVYVNNSQSGNAITFELRDHRGNRFGIGSTIFIEYGHGLHQMRELQASGGYLSFDAPVAHFGLGEEQTVTRVEIAWSTGERHVLDTEFKAGARYIITRSSVSTESLTH